MNLEEETFWIILIEQNNEWRIDTVYVTNEFDFRKPEKEGFFRLQKQINSVTLEEYYWEPFLDKWVHM